MILIIITLCGRGGTGIRAALRRLWGQTREGSTPFVRTSFQGIFSSFLLPEAAMHCNTIYNLQDQDESVLSSGICYLLQLQQ